jgi:Protein of unknown function (DUF3455)
VQGEKTMSNFLHMAGAIWLLIAWQGVGQTRPEGFEVTPGEEVVLEAHAKGVQIYACQLGADQKPAWVFKAPEAELTDAAGKTIVHHSAGPTWKHVDGSEVTAIKAEQRDAPKPGAIPWLRLTVNSHKGEGTLSRVTSIQRIHTEGGLAPSANTCEAATNSKEERIAYEADYVFYAPVKK